MMTTGKLTSKEDYDNLSQEQRADVLKAIDKENKRVLLQETIKTYQKDLNDMMDSNRNGDQNTSIAAARKKLMSMQEQYAKDFLGVDYQQATDTSRSATIEANATRVYGSATSGDLSASSFAARLAGFNERDYPDDAQSATYNRVQKQLRPYWMVEWLGGTQNAEKLKSLVESDKLNKNEVAKLIDKSSEQDIAALVMSEGFDSFIKESGLAAPTSTEGVTTPTPIGEAIDNLKSKKTTQSQKKEALKVLKYYMPDIIMRYTTQ